MKGAEKQISRSLLWFLSQTAAASRDLFQKVSFPHHDFSSADAPAEPAGTKASACFLNRIYLHEDAQPSELFTAEIDLVPGTGIAFAADPVRSEKLFLRHDKLSPAIAAAIPE